MNAVLINVGKNWGNKYFFLVLYVYFCEWGDDFFGSLTFEHLFISLYCRGQVHIMYPDSMLKKTKDT